MRYILTIGFYLIINFSFSQSNTDLYNLGVDFFNKEKYKEADSVFSLMINNGFYDKDVYFNRAAARNKLSNVCGFCSDIALAASHGDNEANLLFWESCPKKGTFFSCSPNLDVTIKDTQVVIIEHDTVQKTSLTTIVNRHSGVASTKCMDDLTKEECKDLKKEPSFTYSSISHPAEFPGGDGELLRFIKANIKYPLYEKEKKIEGKVYVQFTIYTDGSVTDIRLQRGIDNHPNLNNEALRVVGLLPKWIPATTNGKPMKMRFILPIPFKL
ncbi:MAG TPA: energy transducer TonB [Bacteroidia bacterium]|nr:energy transducer TonB [Bacteroidia bacterium]